ncbi:MAG: hypothetical protein IJS07_00200 [Bacteroidales bacterium]|nr:hypothetical protein [Bacteroidales bacterium]
MCVRDLVCILKNSQSYGYSGDGAPAGFVLTTVAHVTSVIDAFDTANSTDFKAWLNSITTEGGTALNSDIRGKARNASAIWPGCYDNGTNITLE